MHYIMLAATLCSLIMHDPYYICYAVQHIHLYSSLILLKDMKTGHRQKYGRWK